MNAHSPPPKTTEQIKAFEIPTRYSEQDITLLAPLWSTSFKKTLETEIFGSVRFQLSSLRAAHSGNLHLTIKVSRHLYYVNFSTADWLDTLLEAFEDNVQFEDFPEAAALALEAHLADELVNIEKAINYEVTFASLSSDAPCADIEDLPGATFKAKSDKWGTAFISIRPANKDANDALVQMLIKDDALPKSNTKTTQNIMLNASLRADATEMSCEQLRKMQPGGGFMLSHSYLETSSLNLVVADTVLATVTKQDDTFKIDESFVPKPVQPKPETPSPRRSRRMHRERAKSDE